MKKYFLFLFAAMLAAAGCERADILDEQVGQSGTETFIATTESSAQTKTTLDSRYNIRWSYGDMISIFQCSTLSSQFRLVDSYDGKTSANFTRVSSSYGGGMFGAGNEFPTNAAVYPYSPNIEVSMEYGQVRFDGIELPDRQYYCPGTFANGSFPMVAVTQDSYDYQLNFKNLCAVIRLNILGNNDVVNAIKIKSNNGEFLCGNVSVSSSYGDVPRIVSFGYNGSNCDEVTLDCSSYPLTLDPVNPTTFDIVVPPVSLSNGFTVKVIDANGGYMSISSSALTIERNDIVVFPSFTYEDSSEYFFSIECGQYIYDFLNLENSVDYAEYDNWHDLNYSQYNNFTMSNIASAYRHILDMGLVPVTFEWDGMSTRPITSLDDFVSRARYNFILKKENSDEYVSGIADGTFIFNSLDRAVNVFCNEKNEFKDNTDSMNPNDVVWSILLDNGNADMENWTLWSGGGANTEHENTRCCFKCSSSYYYNWDSVNQYPADKAVYYSTSSETDMPVERYSSYDIVETTDGSSAFVLPYARFWYYDIDYSQEGTPSSVYFSYYE